MTQLNRSISPLLLVLYGLGTIIGAGIYVLVGKVAGFAGAYTGFAFVIAATVAGITGFTYAELSSRFPQSGGAATFVLHAFQRQWLAALIGWLLVLTGIVSAATISRGVVGYMEYFVHLPSELIIIGVIAVIGLIAIWGIKESVIAAAIVTCLEVGGLILVILVASPSFESILSHSYTILPPTTASFWPGIFAGSFIAFYAFLGFEDMVNLAEEVVKPEKNMPRGIIIALVISTILYLLVVLVALSSLPLKEFIASSAPMSALLAKHGNLSHWMALISLIAITNGALVQIIMASRVIYGMAKQGSTIKWLGYVYPRTQTPVRATILVMIVIIVFALALPITHLAQITSMLILSIFTLINVSLIKVKHHQPEHPGYINLPILVPILGIITCLSLIVMQLIFWLIIR